jgi:valyl-tRNA synthetase
MENLFNKKPYFIVCPPPNVTGSLHIGHCVTFTYIDVIARYKILTNHEVHVIGGTDHAANATTIMVRKNYPDVTPENFYEKAMEWIQNAQNNIINQLKDLGVLMDWSQFCYTMDPLRNEGVVAAFNLLYHKGFIYKAKKLVNWDTHFGTAISDLEVNMKAQESMIYEVEYQGDGFTLTVATTRPETIFADCAIAVHPQDERYHHLIGKTVLIPMINKSIPIIDSTSVLKDFGTGCLKITPAHAIEDYDIWLHHPMIQSWEPVDLMDNYGIFVHDILPQPFKGLDVKAARKLVVDMLQLPGKKIKNQIPVSDRSETIVEWKWADQWFFDVPSFKEDAMQWINDGVVKFWPQALANNYRSWINNLQPWCISRDLPLGHKIPVWYDGYGHQWVAHNSQEAQNKAQEFWLKNNLTATELIQDHHCLDTWFSSGLFHKSALGWPHNQQAVADLIVTGYDILFFWITRMMLMSMALGDDCSFKNVFFHGLVRDKYNNKMSKTKGNTIDPYDIAQEFGWDNLRLTIALNSVNSNDLKLSHDSFQDTKKIITKIKNAHAYCKLHCQNLPQQKPISHNLILNDMMELTIYHINHYKKLMEDFQWNKGVKYLVHNFFYQYFCDYFIEIHKVIKNQWPEANSVLNWIFSQLLLLFHCYCPFLTEEIFQEYGQKNIKNNLWQQVSSIKDFTDFHGAMEIISVIRFFQQVLGSKALEIYCGDNKEEYGNLVSKITKTEAVSHQGIVEYKGASNSCWYLNNINKNPEIFQREIQKCEKKIHQMKGFLLNENFMKNGDADVIDQYQRELQKQETLLKCLEKILLN